MGNYNLNPNLSDKINQGFTTDTEGGLPFPAPVFFVINGDVKSKNDPAPDLFYGGFATDRAQMDSLCARENRKNLANMIPTSMTNTRGELVEIYASRHVIAAPVAKRTIWLAPNGDRTNDFIKGARQHVQILAIVADDKFNIWGPVTLSAKGYQAKNLLAAFDTWSKFTAPIRAAEAPGIPAWLFYLALGTFGKERTQVMVGATSKSPITPIGVYQPEMTPDRLQELYGGDKLAEAIVDYGAKSADWVKAWSGVIQQGRTTTRASGRDLGREEEHFEDELPF